MRVLDLERRGAVLLPRQRVGAGATSTDRVGPEVPQGHAPVQQPSVVAGIGEPPARITCGATNGVALDAEDEEQAETQRGDGHGSREEATGREAEGDDEGAGNERDQAGGRARRRSYQFDLLTGGASRMTSAPSVGR